MNHVIQGSAACLLKLLLPRLATFLRAHGGRIVLAIYDAVLIQFPLDNQGVVVAGAERIMIEAFQELFPGAKPAIDVNAKDVSCWNKDGASDSIDRLVENPFLRL